jgi:hypothetical protein
MPKFTLISSSSFLIALTDLIGRPGKRSNLLELLLFESRGERRRGLFEVFDRRDTGMRSITRERIRSQVSATRLGQRRGGLPSRPKDLRAAPVPRSLKQPGDKAYALVLEKSITYSSLVAPIEEAVAVLGE